MPTYSYTCTQCDHNFDIHQAFTDDALTVCPECGGVLRKVFNSVGVVFKGSGFYRTDSRGSGSKSSTISAGSEKSSSDSGSGSSDSAKSPAKSESKSASPAPAPAATSSTSSTAK